jgi:hypothetical protein
MLCAFFKALGCTILVLLSRIWTISWSSGGSFSGLLSEHVLPIEILEDTLDLLGRLRLSRLLFKSDRLMEDVSYWLFLSRTLWEFFPGEEETTSFQTALTPRREHTLKRKFLYFVFIVIPVLTTTTTIVIIHRICFAADDSFIKPGIYSRFKHFPLFHARCTQINQINYLYYPVPLWSILLMPNSIVHVAAIYLAVFARPWRQRKDFASCPFATNSNNPFRPTRPRVLLGRVSGQPSKPPNSTCSRSKISSQLLPKTCNSANLNNLTLSCITRQL